MREDHLDAEQYISSIIAEGSLIQQDQFFLLSQKLEIYADGYIYIYTYIYFFIFRN